MRRRPSYITACVLCASPPPGAPAVHAAEKRVHYDVRPDRHPVAGARRDGGRQRVCLGLHHPRRGSPHQEPDQDDEALTLRAVKEPSYFNW